jgi:hypothetical protein
MAKTLMIENGRIMWRNFSGAAGRFNAEGERFFTLFLNHDDAPLLEQDGWPVKYLKPREGEDELPQPFLRVKVKFSNNPKARPPVLVMITGNNKTQLPEEMAAVLDYVDIEKADLLIRQFAGNFNGKDFVSVYLNSIYVTIRQDALELKYADYDEVSLEEATGGGQKALEGSDHSTPFSDFEDLGEKREQLALTEAGF